MVRSKKYNLMTLILSLTLLLSACGGNAKENKTIATSVAQTVAAQNLTQETIASATPLPASATTPAFSPALITPAATKVLPTLPAGSSGYIACLKANLTGETIPDGTIMTPGEQFTKIWHIQNNSTCTWDTSYKIVFWDGDILGGAYVYNFPQAAIPGQTVDLPLVFTAPATNGTYKSSWMFQAPDGTTFGVGEYSQPFYAEIVVSDDKKPDYGILSVDYKIVRDPASGCPANVIYTVYATITASGPYEIQYSWAQSDENNGGSKTMAFSAAGSQTISREWKLHLGSSTAHDRWMKIIVIDPFYREYDPPATFSYTCK